MCFFKNRLVIDKKTQPKPSCLDFRVCCLCKAKVFIYSLHCFRTYLSPIFAKFVQKYKLCSFWPTFELCKILWWSWILAIDLCHVHGLRWFWSWKIKFFRKWTRWEYPFVPMCLIQNLYHILFFHKLLKSLSKITTCYWFLFIFFNEWAQKLSENFITWDLFQFMQKLKSFFILNRCFCMIRSCSKEILRVHMQFW